MGLYESDHPDVAGMKGLHLFHFAMSNCSQRVRLALEEKGLEWTSHHVNLPGNEHVSADYQRINPNGVVPTLVHDGQVIIESNDILSYLDEQFPEPPLRPAEESERVAMQECMEWSSAFQPSIKVLSHELLFRPFRQLGDEDLALYQKEHRDPKLVAFLQDYAENGSAWRDWVTRAHEELRRTLAKLEARLEKQPWLSGRDYGLADISWAVNFNRLQQAQVDLSNCPRFQDWGGVQWSGRRSTEPSRRISRDPDPVTRLS